MRALAAVGFMALIVADPVLARAEDAPSVPACRLFKPAPQLQVELQKAGREAALFFARTVPDFPYTSLALTDSEAKKPGTLRLRIISDALEGAVDKKGCAIANSQVRVHRRDALSVEGVCRAASFQQRHEIRCSSGALTVLAARALKQNARSEALVFLLAHEMAHIAHRDEGSFLSGHTLFDLSRPFAAKLDQLKSGCRWKTEQLSREQSADESARDLLLSLVVMEDFRDPALDEIGSVRSVPSKLRMSVADLSRWNIEWAGSPQGVPRSVDDPDLPASDEQVRQAAHDLLCAVLGQNKGFLAVPVLRGSHPEATLRLATVADALLKKSNDVVATPLPSTMPIDLGPLIGDLERVFLVDAQQRAEFYERLTGELCRQINKGPTPEKLQCMAK